jgi:hypothetical protein
LFDDKLGGEMTQSMRFFSSTVTLQHSADAHEGRSLVERVIPLNEDAWEVILALYGRSQALGGFERSYFLFPACEHGNIDPTLPIKNWRSAWRGLTGAIQCLECGLLQNPGETCSDCEADMSGLRSPFKGLPFHDTRHQAITELAESRASDQTIMSSAGHISRKMLEH